MGLIFKGADGAFGNMWKWSVAANMVAMTAAPFIVPLELIYFVQPVLFMTMGYCFRQFQKLNIDKRETVNKMYLLENGQQLIVETYDGILHKLTIGDNHEHEIHTDKKDGVVFIMYNSDRPFKIKAKNASLIDFNLVDRLIKSVSIETKKSTNLYHHLIERQ